MEPEDLAGGTSGRPLAPLDPALIEAVAGAPSRVTGDDALALVAPGEDVALQLAPTRSNLLAAIRLEPGLRVLELGCGGGALTRALGDAGAIVTALEPDPSRARLAAVRCADLPTVTIVAGGLDALPAGDRDADLALIAPIPGVSGLAEPDAPSLAALVSLAAARLGDGGVLVVAVDNPWGLNVLLQAPGAIAERPRTRPGPLQGVPRHPGIASLAAVRALAAGQGLTAGRAFGVHPDRLLPRALVAAAMDTIPEARDLVPGFVREPIGRPAQGAVLLRDPSGALREAYGAGLGLVTASALLLVAGRTEPDVEARLIPGLLFLLPGAEKGRLWRRTRVLRRDAAGAWVLEPVGPELAARSGPLSARERRTPIVVGENGEDLVLHALFDEGPRDARTRGLLATWWTAAHAVATSPDAGGWHFDLAPRNFIVDAAGTWRFVDQELTMDAPVPPAVAAWRSIVFTLADHVLPLGVLPGVDPETTVRDMTRTILEDLGLGTDPADEEAWIAFESDLQHRVRPAIPDAAQEAAALRTILDRRVGAWTGHVPLDRLLDAPAEAARDAAAAQVRADGAEARARDAESRALDAEAAARSAAAAAQAAAAASVTAAETRARSAERRADEADAAAREAASRASRSPIRSAGDWARRRSRSLLAGDAANPLFDADWYLERYPDVRTGGGDAWRHYARHGAAEGRDPNAWFDTDWYLAEYPDVRASGLNPLDHFLQRGLAEGRRPSGRTPPGSGG